MGGEKDEEGIWAERKNEGINKATIVALRGHLGGKLMMRSEFGRLKDDPASTGINLAVKNGEECAGKEGRTDGEILTGDFPPDLDGEGMAKNERMEGSFGNLRLLRFFFGMERTLRKLLGACLNGLVEMRMGGRKAL